MSTSPNPQLTQQIARELSLPEAGVRNVLQLSSEGATVPFMARYRKEASGGLDEVQIRLISERGEYLTELEARRAVILSSIEQQGALTDALLASITRAASKADLEDLYAPYKPKRRTRAAQARERGLEPLAEMLWSGAPELARPGLTEAARRFVNPQQDVSDVEAALSGARDICAERLSDVAAVRKRARELVKQEGSLSAKKTKAHAAAVTKFDTYNDYAEPLLRVAGHRYLALVRGEADGVLKLKISVPTERFHVWAYSQIPGARNAGTQVRAELERCVEDATSRLILPAGESDVTAELLDRAHDEAIAVFAKNLRQLLLAAPLGGKRILAVDPGQRTGCKCVVLDEQGQLVHHTVIYLVQGPAQLESAKATICQLVKRYRIEALAIGNGTHGRETERFVKDALAQGLGSEAQSVLVVSVNEAGASVYSASDVARRELPDHDVTVRGAASIGRRLQDPLAELVKIDPKSIGVGQYQHDVNQKALGAKLKEVVESCVNEVGVELNTASAELLSYVSGIGAKTADAILAHRAQHGAFSGRNQLLKVKGLGPKAFEQCAGFLRIAGAKNPLDASAVHPERYEMVAQMAKDLGTTVPALIGNQTALKQLKPERYQSAEVGAFTLEDILKELNKPGRDPREEFTPPKFDDAVTEIGHLKPGQELEGVVTNVTAFGAFVDVGVHQDGLVHISQLANHFVKDPNSVVSVGDKLKVRVLEVDVQRKRISLSARSVTRPGS